MARTSTKSSPVSQAGDAPASETDPCGFGCHEDGAPAGAVSVGCEHGTYAVTEGMRVRAVAGGPASYTGTHDPSLSYPVPAESADGKQTPTAFLVGEFNKLSERVLRLEGAVAKSEAAITALGSELSALVAAAGEQPDQAGGK